MGIPGASLVAQTVKHLPAMWETWVRSLGWEDPLEKEIATHSSKKKKRKKRWEYQTTLLASWEICMQVKKQQLEPDMEQRTGECQGCILSPCLFNLYAEYTVRNAGVDEAQAGSKIAGRNIHNLRYADDTTLMVESEEELKSLLMKVKEESEKAGFKLNIQKTKVVASGPITSLQIVGETVEILTDFIFFISRTTNHYRQWLQSWN